MFERNIAGLTIVTALASAMTGLAGATEPVAGEKLDSGVGSLPPYVQWHRHPDLARLAAKATALTPVAKQDSGLGSLPPYTQWHRYPELARLVEPAPARAASQKAGTDLVAGLRD